MADSKITINAKPDSALVLAQSLIDVLGGLLGCGPSFGDFPFHFAGADFILRDAARLAGTGIDDGRCAGLELAGATGCDQDVPVIAVETFDQLHGTLHSKTDSNFVLV